MSILEFIELLIKGVAALVFYGGIISGIRCAIKHRVSRGGKVNE